MKSKKASLVSALATTFVVALFPANRAHAFGSSPPAATPTSTPTTKPTSTPTSTPTTKPSPSPSPIATSSPSPTPTPPGFVSGVTVERIVGIASSSSCATYSWKDRGKAPAGYTKGMALSFARSLCRQKSLGSLTSSANLMSEANTGNAAKDAIAQYASNFNSLSMVINVAGAETLKSLYTLGMGLGMRESSGKYCEGYDTSAGSETSSEAEAGTFQASYNSMSASPELSKLYAEYQADPSRCQLETYKEGVSCSSQGIVGSGAGATYQKFAKSCPAFTAEYTMALLRVLRAHFGPINRKEAEVIPACNTMFDNVKRYVEEDPVNACKELM